MSQYTYGVRSSARVLQLDVGLLVDAVEILVEGVQDEGQHLLRVVLLIAGELRRESRYLVLKHGDMTVRTRNDGNWTK